MPGEKVLYERRRRAAWRRSRSTTPRRATRSPPELLEGLIAALRARPRGGRVRAASCCAPRTSARSPRAPTSAASPPTCRSSTSTSARERFVGLFKLIGELGKPTICAARGHVLAGALGIALACDLIVASRGRELRHARDQRRRLPVHDHGADLPQRAAQEGQRAAAAGRALERRARRWRRASSTASSPTRSSTRRSPTGPGKLAGKSPVIMRLGKEAMRRQLDMPLDDALDYLRAQLTLAHVHRGHRRGRQRLLREARPVWKGHADRAPPPDASGEPPADLAAAPAGRGPARAPRADRARRRRGEDRPPARAGEAHRPRAPRAADRRGHLRRAGHPRAARTSPSGRWRARTRRPTA